MKVLVIGGGGREHALAWKLAQSPKRADASTSRPATAAPRSTRACRTSPSPTPPRCRLRAEGEDRADRGRPRSAAGGRRRRRVPRARPAHLRADPGRRAAGKLEGLRQGLHEAPRDPDRRVRDLHRRRARRTPTSTRKGAPIVVKADGLAAGKGVVVATTLAEAHEAIDFMLPDNKLGVAQPAARGRDRGIPAGEEASFIVLCDGKNVLPLATSQDHKRLLDGDAGPEHRRHGRLFAGAGGHAERACAGDARDHPADHARHGEGRHSASPASCTPA